MARILIVDDEPFLRRILTYMLTGAGHEIDCAEDGEQAWERLTGSDPPDLVISDLMMPGISGVELTRRFREWLDERQGKYVPVMILTARGQRVDEDEAHRSGADSFMTKPFSSQELLEKVTRMLAGAGGGPQIETEREATGTDG